MPAPLTIAEFDPLQWVNDYARPGAPIDAGTFQPILQFSLMWNLFERDACGRKANPASIERVVDEALVAGRLHANRFAEHLQYFRTRAVRSSMTIERYLDALRMTNAKRRHLVSGVLNGQLGDPKNSVCALLLIAHRIRNNIFHGEKEVAALHTQAELFRAVNSLLAIYLETTRVAA